MVDITKAFLSTSTAGAIVIASLGSTAAVASPSWPEIAQHRYNLKFPSRTYSAIVRGEAVMTNPVEAFASKVQNIFAEFAVEQVSLGEEFEAAIFSDVESLYEL